MLTPMSTPESFSAVFDAIDVAPRSFTPPAPAEEQEETPGFSLLDDAGGRFAIDRATGIITVLDRELLITESGARHGVHVRVVEPSGASYELRLTLRITGLVPQIFGSNENEALAAMARDLATLIEAPPASEPVPTPTPRFWPRLAALNEEAARFGALVAGAALPAIEACESLLRLTDAPPTPSSPSAAWAI